METGFGFLGDVTLQLINVLSMPLMYPIPVTEAGGSIMRWEWLQEVEIYRLNTLLTAVDAKGYRGIFVDDVSFDFRISDGDGNPVTPMDPNTGQLMTQDNWRKYFADFLEQLKASLPPGTEICHNSAWFAGTQGNYTFINRQISAANYLDLERGANDAGYTGGTGTYSFYKLFQFVDHAHSLGTHVVWGAYDGTPLGRELNLAAYLMVTDTGDGVGSAEEFTPDNWWAGFDLDLGVSLGPRTLTNGLWRREFAAGTVLFNEPSAATQIVQLTSGGPYTRIDGTPVTSVVLNAREAAVLLHPPVTVSSSTTTTTTTTTSSTSARASTSSTTSTSLSTTSSSSTSTASVSSTASPSSAASVVATSTDSSTTSAATTGVSAASTSSTSSVSVTSSSSNLNLCIGVDCSSIPNTHCFQGACICNDHAQLVNGECQIPEQTSSAAIILAKFITGAILFALVIQ